MKQQTRVEPKTVAAAERQMQAWALSQQIAERTIRVDREQRPAIGVGKYIAISREAGAGGSEIAVLVGEKLGWEVLDKSLLDRIAHRYRLSRPGLEAVDETTTSWAYDVIGAWLDSQIVSHEKYVAHLSRMLLAAARRGNVIFVGRGAQFLLPPERGLAVRLIASEQYRLEQIMRRRDLSAAEARQLMNKVDRGRREFVRHFFHRDITDPHLYDLVINVGSVGQVAAAKLIVDVYCG